MSNYHLYTRVTILIAGFKAAVATLKNLATFFKAFLIFNILMAHNRFTYVAATSTFFHLGEYEVKISILIMSKKPFCKK
jgi:hypothetical protein